MKVFTWKSVNFGGNAQKVGEELEQLEIQGKIDAEDILRYAEDNKDSELYKCFEWNDKTAGDKYRLWQARQILCSISVQIIEKPRKVQRVYVNIKDKEENERVFKNIKDVITNYDEYQQLMEKAKNDITRSKEKYDDLLAKEDLKDILFDIYRTI